jgi:hypothetical protein
VTTLKGPAWYFDEGVYLETIYDEDYGAIQRDGPEEYKSNITINTKCIYISDPSFDNLDSFSKRIAIKLKFVLNNFSTGTPVVLPYAALLGTSGKARILQTADIEAVANLHTLKKQSYRIKPKADRETISTYYKVVSKTCDNNPTLFFTLERFNSCLTRSEIFDRIVDVTISLESLISGTQELRHRFALYNSFIAESEVQPRLDAFDLFVALYDARSGIVHGDVSSKDKEKLLTRVRNNWDEILRLATASINYHLLFLYERNKAEWDRHLKHLVFGRDSRIV